MAAPRGLERKREREWKSERGPFIQVRPNLFRDGGLKGSLSYFEQALAQKKKEELELEMEKMESQKNNDKSPT